MEDSALANRPIERTPSVSKRLQSQDARRIAAEREVDELFRTHSTGLLRYTRILAECTCVAQEAVQEAFLKYYVHRLRFDPPSSPWEWLCRAARDYVVTYQKAHSHKNHVCLKHAFSLPDGGPSPEQALVEDEALQKIYDLMAPRELECLRLRQEGFSYKEISEILDIEAGTVGAMLARATSKILKSNSNLH